MIKQLLCSLILSILLVEVVESRSQYVRCFQRLERSLLFILLSCLSFRKSIDNYQPLAEFFYVTPHHCIDQCVTATNNAIKVGLCRSFVYNHLQHSCRLYDHDGNQIPAIVHPAAGYDLYKRTATTQECGGPLQRFFVQTFKHKESDELAKAAPTFQIQTPVQFGDSTITTTELPQKELLPPPASAESFDIEEAGAPSARPEVSDDPNVRDLDDHSNQPNKETKKNIISNRVFPRQEPSKPKEAPVIRAGIKLPPKLKPAVEYTRPCRTSTGFYLANGSEMIIPQDYSTTPITTINNTDRRQCLDHCATNTNQNNGTFKCLALNFDEEKGVCTLFGVLAQPHGYGTLVENASISYAEKFCLPSGHNNKCSPNDIFELDADRLISQNILASTTSNTLIDCLRSCLNIEGCKCSSYDSKRKQCILHDACSKDIRRPSDGWIIISNGCMPPQIDQNAKVSGDEWSSWSKCLYGFGRKHRIRVRTRKCTLLCEKETVQIERCNP